MIAATAALIVANSAFAAVYFHALHVVVAGLSIQHWINDALMAIFFLLVGSEIKREFLEGQLGSWPRRFLPGIAAAGGIVAPALIYLAVNATSAATLHGWAIPTATDIAFALGVLALLGRRVPVSLKVFLTALAIIDDLAAVTIIAAFYASELSSLWLTGSLATLAVLIALNQFGVERLATYLVVGAALWLFVLNSGVHPTLAGVALAFVIPLRASPGHSDHPASPLHVLERFLHPWVAFCIIPAFGFANAGVSLAGMTWSAALAPVPLGIAAGLFFGKQIGVFLTTWSAIRLGIADCPQNASLPQVYGVSLLCGIGFTMSLFIGLLAFPTSQDLQDAVKIGVLFGSVLSALVGVVVLLLCAGPPSGPLTESR